MADAVARHGGPAYVSRFSRVPPGAPGATHVADGRYYLGAVKAGERFYRESDAEMSRDMMRRFVAFAARGNPNVKELEPQWPAWDTERSRYMDFGDRAQIRAFEERPKLDQFQKQLRTW